MLTKLSYITISLPLDLFYPVALFLSERRPAALVLSILKEHQGSAFMGTLFRP